MISSEVNSALDEVSFLKSECLGLLDSALSIIQPPKAWDYPDAFRNLVTPFIYSVWERCFTTCFSIMLKLIQVETSNYSKLNHNQAAVWLQRESFFISFIAKMRHHPPADDQPTRKSIKGSSYQALVDFISSSENWRKSNVNVSTDTSTLVMTFSNVNTAVLDVNAAALGIAEMTEFVKFRSCIGRLDDLVGRRNDIGHGTLARPPGNLEFKELFTLARSQLVDEFCDVVQQWILFR